MIDKLLTEIQHCVRHGHLHVALIAALTVPDIAGTFDPDTGVLDPARKSKPRYSDWFDKYVAPTFGDDLASKKGHISGEDCYNIRCALVHEGRSKSRKNFYRARTKHEIAYGGALHDKAKNEIFIDVSKFCQAIVNGAYSWLEEIEDAPLFDENIKELMQMYELRFKE